MGKANSTGVLSVRGKDCGVFRLVVSCGDAALPAICSWLPVLLLSRLPQNSSFSWDHPWPACRMWLLMNMHLVSGYRPGPLSFLGFFHLRDLFCCRFRFVDATKITLAPSSADINVGDNLTLQCHASHDPTMDLTFTWTLDDFPIDFDKPGGHYRRASVVRPEAPEFSLLPDKTGDLRWPQPL